MLMDLCETAYCSDIVWRSRQAAKLEHASLVGIAAGDDARCLFIADLDARIGNRSTIGADHHAGDTAELESIQRIAVRSEGIRRSVNLREANAAGKADCKESRYYSALHGPVPRYVSRASGGAL